MRVEELDGELFALTVHFRFVERVLGFVVEFLGAVARFAFVADEEKGADGGGGEDDDCSCDYADDGANG